MFNSLIPEFVDSTSVQFPCKLYKKNANNYLTIQPLNEVCYYGGERGIRTLGTTVSSTRDFQSRSFGQLGHLSGTLNMPNVL